MSQYWYIKHREHGPLRITNGGFTTGEWDGWCHGIHDITRFPTKKLAADNLKVLRQLKTIKEQKNFVLVKVKSKNV